MSARTICHMEIYHDMCGKSSPGEFLAGSLFLDVCVSELVAACAGGTSNPVLDRSLKLRCDPAAEAVSAGVWFVRACCECYELAQVFELATN
jgi:hypothetical protein